MLTLGFSGGLNRVHENPFELPGAFSHDGAAVIVRDGEVIAAIEEERLNRIKHSNKFPTQSIRFCLDAAGASLDDVDQIAFYATENYCDTLLSGIYLDRPEMRHRHLACEASHCDTEKHCSKTGHHDFVLHFVLRFVSGVCSVRCVSAFATA